MTTLTVPFHLDERLPGLPVPGVPVGATPSGGTLVERLATLHDRLADAVAAHAGGEGPVTVAVGDCSAALGVVAGLQRAGTAPSVVWYDAHGDFNTAATSPSGYLGGMPLAMLTGRDDLGLASRLGLVPVPDDRVVLSGARDVDADEEAALAASTVRRLGVEDVVDATLPPGPLYLHVDLDVVDPADSPGHRYPAPGGPSAAAVAASLERVLATGRVAASTVACTWTLAELATDRPRALLDRLGL